MSPLASTRELGILVSAYALAALELGRLLSPVNPGAKSESIESVEIAPLVTLPTTFCSATVRATGVLSVVA